MIILDAGNILNEKEGLFAASAPTMANYHSAAAA
jgi:hypothetical protein